MPEGRRGRPPFAPGVLLRFRHMLERHKLATQILQSVNDLLSQRADAQASVRWHIAMRPGKRKAAIKRSTQHRPTPMHA